LKEERVADITSTSSSEVAALEDLETPHPSESDESAIMNARMNNVSLTIKCFDLSIPEAGKATLNDNAYKPMQNASGNFYRSICSEKKSNVIQQKTP